MDPALVFALHFIAVCLIISLSAKNLGVGLVYALCLVTLYPNITYLYLLDLFLLPSLILANFRS